MSDKLKANDRVQFVDEKNGVNTLFEGVIVDVFASVKPKPQDYWKYSVKEQKDFITHVKVKWDDGTVDNKINIEEITRVDTLLEREFRTISNVAVAQIQEKISQASKFLGEAESLADKYGVPFNADISRVSQNYTPNSYIEKYGEIDPDVAANICGEYPQSYGNGWAHSAVC